MTQLVLNIRSASPSAIAALDRHCRKRVSDGTASRIDPSRSHLNRVLVGDEAGVSASLKNWFQRTKARRPTRQADRPYVTLVVGPGLGFVDEGGSLADFNSAALEWLRTQAGDDIVHAELHLDETSPHMHVVVAPTYERKKRIPGRRKKAETEGEFQARRAAAAEGPGTRTVGRASTHWGQRGAYDRLRLSAVEALSPLGIEYGRSRKRGEARTARSTRAWVEDQAVALDERAETVQRRGDLVIRVGDKLQREGERLKKARAELAADRARLEQAVRAFYELNSRLRGVMRALADGVRRLRREVPSEGLRPKARQALNEAISQFETTLEQAGIDMKYAAQGADETLNQAVERADEVLPNSEVATPPRGKP